MRLITVRSVLQWMIVAAVSSIVLLPFYRKGKLSRQHYICSILLAFYCPFLFYITVAGRRAGDSYQCELELFWAYKRAFAGITRFLWGNFWNVVLFIPIGVLLGALVKRKWFVPVFGMVISIVVELAQLITKRGLFEFDDILHNTVGAGIGVLLFLLFVHVASYTAGNNSGQVGREGGD